MFHRPKLGISAIGVFFRFGLVPPFFVLPPSCDRTQNVLPTLQVKRQSSGATINGEPQTIHHILLEGMTEMGLLFVLLSL